MPTHPKGPPLPLSLPELLRRCHRDELLPLADVLKVNPTGLGLAKLADVLAWTLRRAGGHEVQNILLRGGKGPPYSEVLVSLAGRCKVTPGQDTEQTELALLEWWVARALDELDGERKAALWKVLGMEGEPPQPGEDAAAKVRESLGRGFGMSAGVVVATGVGRVASIALVPILGPLLPLATILWAARPRDDVLLPAVLEVARLRQQVKHRVTVGVVGSPSSGKDAGIKAIFGLDSHNISPVAGSTREVSITRLEGATALFVVNTPGMGDVVQSVTEEARQVLDHIDVFVYVLNAQGGVQAREKADYQACRERRRPVLVVVNKIDTLRPKDLERYLADARDKLRVEEDDFLAAAFDPLPQLAEAPIWVDLVQSWIAQHLSELGKDTSELPCVADAETPEPATASPTGSPA